VTTPKQSSNCDRFRNEVVFNYLGQFDQTLSSHRYLNWLKSPAGKRTACRDRSELLNVNVLWLMAVCNWWMYSEAVHRRSTIEDLAQRFVEALRSIIAHSVSRGRRLHTFGLPAGAAESRRTEALGMVEFEGDMQDEVKKY